MCAFLSTERVSYVIIHTPTSNSLTLCFTRLWMIISVGTKSTSPQASRSSHVTKHTPLQDTIAHIPDHHPPFFPLHTLAPTTINNRTAPPYPTVPITCGEIPRHMPHTQSHQISMPLLPKFMLRSQSKKSFRFMGNALWIMHDVLITCMHQRRVLFFKIPVGNSSLWNWR